MLELLTGTGLAAAAGLNAYIPLLAMGIAGRVEWIQLPQGWVWLENEWVMVILGVLLLIELVADKIPAVDTVNDVVQTLVRPASGGIVFSGGLGTSTLAVEDPSSLFTSGAWISVLAGIGLALVVSLAKSALRPAANVVTAGLAAPALSTAEDGASLALVVLAFVAPIFVVVALVLLALWFLTFFQRMRRRKRADESQLAT
jgi:uncharacterized membrane protein